MTSLEELNSIFGEDGKQYFEYLKNKQKGGINNSKGNTFENYFAIHQIAKSVNENADLDKTLFSSQAFCFIDDLVMEQTEERINHHYQIKDVLDLNWKNGRNSVSEDFIRQYEMSRGTSITSHLGLVVSREKLRETLIEDIPEEIKNTVRVIHFQSASSLNNLIRHNSLIKDELSRLCALRNPSIDKLETLGPILLGSWDTTNKTRVSLRELLNSCYTINPNFIKGHSTRVSQKLNDIFLTLEGFDFVVENGFLQWSYNATDSGVLQYRIGTREFEQWENDVFNSDIKKFEDIEPFLAS